MARSLKWCVAPPEETELPCQCGATVSGDDPVRGVCQALNPRPKSEPYIRLVITDKTTGEII